jgi:chromosome segregation ATPase
MHNSNVLIDTIMEASAALASRSQQEAINILGKITSEVQNEQKLAKVKEQNAKTSLLVTIEKISNLIIEQGKVHEGYEAANSELQELFTLVTAKKVAVANISLEIDKKDNELIYLNNQLTYNQYRIDDLNDTSVESILRSVLTLGMDRAIKAISIEIDGVKNQISNTNRTRETYLHYLNELHAEFATNLADITIWQISCNNEKKKIDELKKVETQLHNQEDEQRKKVVFYTEVNIFYIKLEGLLCNISNRLNDVADIVSILENNTPTIASFDPSTPSLITLKQAIVLFKNTLNESIITTFN